MSDKLKDSPLLADLDILDQALDERKKREDRRKKMIELPPEIERRSGQDRRGLSEKG